MMALPTAGPAGMDAPAGPVSQVTRAWGEHVARQLRGRLGHDLTTQPAPVYGSPEWHALDPQHPLRFVALLNAAEFWRHDVEDLPRRVEAELAAARWAADRVEAERFAEQAAWVRRTAGTPTHDELERLRAQITRPTGYSPRPWPAGQTA